MVIGAGPTGLRRRRTCWNTGSEPLVLEAGPGAGAAVAQWQHVRLFSSWSELIDPAAASCWRDRLAAPTAGLPDRGGVGRALPGAAGVGAGRPGPRTARGDRRRRRAGTGSSTPAATPSRSPSTCAPPRARSGSTARAVIDASGTWATPNPLGADGCRRWVSRPRPPDRLPGARPAPTRPRGPATPAAQRRGRRLGHCALTALVAFAALAEQEPGTRIVWLLRRGVVGNVFGGGDADQLPARGALGRGRQPRSRPVTSRR